MNYRTVVIDPTASIAPNATILGDVTIGADSLVMSGASLRGDYGSTITVGAGTNIQENCVFHVDPECSCVIGDGMTVSRDA